jgi:hypothetical protein
MHYAGRRAMAWRDRLRELMLAGGALAIGGCSSGSPCVNASSDPCICGRPDEDPVAKMQCEQKKACVADGGTWDPYTVTAGTGVPSRGGDAGRDAAGGRGGSGGTGGSGGSGGLISVPHCVPGGADGGLD